MAQHIFRQVWTAMQNLNPAEVRALSDQSILVGLHASRDADYEMLEEFLCPSYLSRERRLEIYNHLWHADDKNAPPKFDIEIYTEGMPRPGGTFVYRPEQPLRIVADILAMQDGYGLPLARIFPPFRKPVVDRVIHTISKENAFFSIATALPDMVPNLMTLPWAVGEFASDTAFLTGNQVRMAFLIAAASDRNIGYSEQRGEVGSILASAFGWRAIARELVGKIPFGGGLIPKAAVAYAGTFVAGRVLERFYREGYSMSRGERKDAYDSAFEAGKRVAKELIAALPTSKVQKASS